MKSYLISNAKTDCSGCGACADICSKKCITLEDDEYGFKYPVINKADCISCGLCQRVCPFQSSSFRTKNDAFYGKSADDETIRRSSSGGAFTELYHEFMCSGGIVYGVEFDKEIRTVYGRATSVEECQRFRKSKYVLAETEHCFSKVCNDLREGRDVLFSGTPCICSALNNYLALRRVSTENLLTVEIVCHGAASNSIFRQFLDDEEKRYKSTVKAYEFRHKPESFFRGEKVYKASLTSLESGREIDN